ncbi:porin [soil metagenome]
MPIFSFTTLGENAMKKSYLALAVLSAFAASVQAQTNVTVGGIVQVDIKSYSVGNTTRASANETRIDDDFGSRFWLTGSEDLGGGNAAIFYIENRFNTDVNNVQGNGNGLANGDTWVGLKGGWGQVTAGKHQMMFIQGLPTEAGLNGNSSIPNNMRGTYNILDSVNGTSLTTTRVNNSVMYRSPNFSGFSGSIGVGASGSNGNEGTLACTGTGVTSIVSVVPAAGSTTQTATCPTLTTATNGDYSTGRQLYVQGNYTSGPIYVNLAYWNTTVEGRPATVTAATADQRALRLSTSYALPMGLKIGLQVDRSSLQSVGRAAGVGGADRIRTAWEIPINYTFGPNTVLFSYTKAGNINVANSGAKMYVLGWDYQFSKRTNVGIFYSRLNNDAAGVYQPFSAGTSGNGSTLLAGESVSTLALGMKHTF